MDSYEYYLLYHQHSSEFMLMLTQDNSEILTAISKLINNKKVTEHAEILFTKVLKFIENDDQFNLLLDELLEQLITLNSFDVSKKTLNKGDINLSSLRIAKVIVDYALKNSCFDEDLRKFCSQMVEFIFKQTSIQHYAIGVLYGFLKYNSELKKSILNEICEYSLRRTDSLSMQNMCFFFKEICESGLNFGILNELLQKYFENDSIQIKKQGVYLVKCLLDYNMINLENAENWKKFITIFEKLEDNQSHLIMPSLELLHEFQINEEFEYYWFSLSTMIFNHENNLVKKYGLSYILGMNQKIFNKLQVLKILEALNRTYLFDPTEVKFLEKVQKFVDNNSKLIFELLIEINWMSVPFYYVLMFIGNIKNISNILKELHKDEFLQCLEKQTEVLPKRIRNVKIRGLIKRLYAELLESIIDLFQATRILKTFINIFRINKNHECIDMCFDKVKREDYEIIFRDDNDYDFLKYFLCRAGRNIDDIKLILSHMKNSQKLSMEVLCHFNETTDGYEDVPNEMIHEIFEHIWASLRDQNVDLLNNSIDLMDIVMRTSKETFENEIFGHVMEIWAKINGMLHENSQLENAFIKLSIVILQYDSNFEAKFIAKYVFRDNKSQKYLSNLTLCQALVLQNYSGKSLEVSQNLEHIDKVIRNIDTLLEGSITNVDIVGLRHTIRIFVSSLSQEILQRKDILDKIMDILKNFIKISLDIIESPTELWKDFLSFTWKLIEISKFHNNWIFNMVKLFDEIQSNIKENDRFYLNLAMLDFVKSNSQSESDNQLIKYFKSDLMDTMLNVYLMTRDEQIENMLLSTSNNDVQTKLNFRLEIARTLVNKSEPDFREKLAEKIMNLAETSNKKVRYYPNSKIHRLKLHHFQPLVFCNKIEKKTIDVLIHELLWINNQLNVSYILEIILALHHPDILMLLKADGKDLNAQALKSIFSIALMQIRAEKDFKKCENMLEQLFQNIFPFSMGQNFGVRIYSLTSIVLSFEHVSSLSDFIETPVIMKISQICEAIMQSVKQKNCYKYFITLRSDFRFTKSLNALYTPRVFYREIPRMTSMPFEEIILGADQDCDSFVVADMTKEIDCITVTEELEISTNNESKNSSVNLQRKYLPLKNQIPGDVLLKTLPERFKPFDKREKILIPKSELIIVASLIDNNTNLGGLARTCEIFGTSKYVIHSLKSQENFEFKSLSKTSEKWINIAEVKDWQLTDYLIFMKRSGYTIVGGEQSENSVSLLEVKFPSKCVFLLGNEKKGIPANLLSLLDLVVEIPQAGVVRSLNVHVAGAILIWEYTKQNLYKGS